MMRWVTGGLGVLTLLAVTGSVTPSGQAMLGLRPTEAVSSPVTVIKDAPPLAEAEATRATPARLATVTKQPAAAAAPAPARPAPAAAMRVAPVRVAAAPAVRVTPAPVPARRPAPPAPVGRPAVAAPAAQPPSGLGQMASVANILLNLPQVLSETQVRPAPDNGPARRQDGHPVWRDQWTRGHPEKVKKHRADHDEDVDTH